MTANFANSKAGYLGLSVLNTLDPLYGADAQPCTNADSGRPSSPSSTRS